MNTIFAFTGLLILWLHYDDGFAALFELLNENYEGLSI